MHIHTHIHTHIYCICLYMAYTVYVYAILSIAAPYTHCCPLFPLHFLSFKLNLFPWTTDTFTSFLSPSETVLPQTLLSRKNCNVFRHLCLAFLEGNLLLAFSVYTEGNHSRKPVLDLVFYSSPVSMMGATHPGQLPYWHTCRSVWSALKGPTNGTPCQSSQWCDQCLVFGKEGSHDHCEAGESPDVEVFGNFMEHTGPVRVVFPTGSMQHGLRNQNIQLGFFPQVQYVCPKSRAGAAGCGYALIP